jgi:hypothetical protein
MRLGSWGWAASLAVLTGQACRVAPAASNLICQPSQLVRCNDCSQPPTGSTVYRGWAQCSADGTTIGACNQCAPDNGSSDQSDTVTCKQSTTACDSTSACCDPAASCQASALKEIVCCISAGKPSTQGDGSDCCSGALTNGQCASAVSDGGSGDSSSMDASSGGGCTTLLYGNPIQSATATATLSDGELVPINSSGNPPVIFGQAPPGEPVSFQVSTSPAGVMATIEVYYWLNEDTTTITTIPLALLPSTGGQDQWGGSLDPQGDGISVNWWVEATDICDTSTYYFANDGSGYTYTTEPGDAGQDGGFDGD